MNIDQKINEGIENQHSRIRLMMRLQTFIHQMKCIDNNIYDYIEKLDYRNEVYDSLMFMFVRYLTMHKITNPSEASELCKIISLIQEDYILDDSTNPSLIQLILITMLQGISIHNVIREKIEHGQYEEFIDELFVQIWPNIHVIKDC